MSWMTPRSVQVVGDAVVLRLVPDVFDPSIDQPAREVTLAGVANIDFTVKTLSEFLDEFVIEYAVESGELRLWDEWGGKETVIPARSVSERADAYTTAELHAIAAFLSNARQSDDARARQAETALSDIRRFVVGLAERAEMKRVLSDRSMVSADAHVSTLRRILNRVDSARAVGRPARQQSAPEANGACN